MVVGEGRGLVTTAGRILRSSIRRGARGGQRR